MKNSLFVAVCFLLSSFQFSKAQNSFAILQDWADYIGYQDTVYKIPSTYDAQENFITASFTVDNVTGADILVAVYDTNGMLKWSETWSGSGNNRDQAVDVITDDSCNIFVTGMSYSPATNFDIVVLKYDSSGNLKFSYTLNGTANNYDMPAAIGIFHNFLYVTGEVSDSVSLLNYVTIQLNKSTGVLNWKRRYDAANYFDVAFAMDILDSSSGIGATQVAGVITIAGASQDTLNRWKYCTIIYDSTGTELDTTRINGTSNSFDRPMAIKSDALGNFYITGAATDSGASFNVRTAKIDTSGGLAWIIDFGSNAKDDEGNDLLVDDSGYVYVGGKSNSYLAQTQDYLLVKYSTGGVQQWFRTFDADTNADEAVKMCFDNYGNILMTGSATRNNKKDILTIAFNPAGDTIWKTYFNGEFGGDDRGTDILSDDRGNIYVTGQMQITDTTWQQVTIKYKTNYFTVPQDTVSAPSSLLFYRNNGQIIDAEDSLRSDVFYYTINQFPKLYFHEDSISFVMTHIDDDTTTTDTLERIDLNFQDGDMHKEPYVGGLHDSDQVLNYFLTQCPNGITTYGSEKLFYSKVYDNIDIIFSNNNAGMKFQIIVNEGGNTNDITLHFTGHQSLSLISNSDLEIDGMLGTFTYERPLIYQLDGLGNRIPLGWLASYYIVDSANVKFILGGEYDLGKPLVIECARFYSFTSYPHIKNLEWSTYFGGVPGLDRFNDVRVDNDHNVYAIGETQSLVFPSLFPIQFGNHGDFDVVVSQFDSGCVLRWSTYLGGSTGVGGAPGREFGNAIAPDNKGNVYLVGNTLSTDFPLKYEAGAFMDSTVDQGEIFIAKLSSDGTQLIWSTYFGDTTGWVNDMDLDNKNNLFIVGGAQVGLISFGAAYNSSVGTAIIAAFDSTDNPFWITHYGDNINSIAVGRTGDFENRVFITGYTGNGNIPIAHAADSFCSGLSDMFIACFYDSYNLNWSTYWGGSSGESGQGIAVDDTTKLVYVVGNTSSNDFPCLVDWQFIHAYMDSIYQPNNFGVDGYDAVILRFDENGFIEYSTLYGDTAANSANDVVANNHNIYISGTATGGALPMPIQQPPYAYVSAYKDSNNINYSYSGEGFIVGMNDSLELIWASYYGSWTYEQILGLCYDNNKSKLYVVGVEDEGPLGNPLNSFPWVDYDSSTTSDYFRDFGSSLFEGSCFIAKFDTRAIPGVGINEINDELFNFTVYPNPAIGKLNLLFDLIEKQNVHILIYNSMGQLLLSKELGSKQGNIKDAIDVSNFPMGIYLISLQTEKLRSAVTVVIQ